MAKKKLGKLAGDTVLPQFQQGITPDKEKSEKAKTVKTGWIIPLDAKLKVAGLKYTLAQKYGIRVSEQEIVSALISMADENKLLDYFSS